MNTLSHYLYQYPQSKNYYFRFRIPIENKNYFQLEKQHFTCTLKTSDLSTAQWLSIFIKNKLCCDMDKLIRMDIGNSIPETWDFYAYLKNKFQTHLNWGKKLLASQSFKEEISQFEEFTDNDITDYKEYLENLIQYEKDDIPVLNKQIAHKPYMLNYINDYQAFIKSSMFADLREENPIQRDITKPSYPETFFSENIYDEEFYNEVPDSQGRDDPYAMRRFVARHAWIETEFKKHLIKELKAFESSFNPFDQEVKAKPYSPTEYSAFLEVLETLKETKKILKEYKQEREDIKAKRLVVPLKETFEQFIKEKSKSIKSKSVRLYEISFNFLYEQLGEDYDITQFNRKKAIEIKELVCRKEINRKGVDGTQEISVRTVNRNIVNYGAFFNWCYQHDKISENELFKNLKLKQTKESGNRHRPYTTEEINKLWDYKFIRKNEASRIRNDALLYIKVGMFTAMRLNEISGLITENFKNEGGVDYISLIGNEVKTESSERKIPIHKELINIGLLDLVKKRREEKQPLIFPELRTGKTSADSKGWGEPVSKWVNERLLRNIGIDKVEERKNGKLIDFHSFRTTFLSECKNLGFNEYLVTQFAGHLQQDDITFQVYGAEVSTKLSVMRDMINQVDLRKLK